jgi:hypothetical protein
MDLTIAFYVWDMWYQRSVLQKMSGLASETRNGGFGQATAVLIWAPLAHDSRLAVDRCFFLSSYPMPMPLIHTAVFDNGTSSAEGVDPVQLSTTQHSPIELAPVLAR